MTGKLQEYLDTTVMRHISHVHKAFELCTCEEDIEEVIDMIPHVYGGFSYEADEEGFTIYNWYREYDDETTEELRFDWAEVQYRIELLNENKDEIYSEYVTANLTDAQKYAQDLLKQHGASSYSLRVADDI